MTLIINMSPPKSGTTALYHCLVRTGVVAAPKIKEPRYFTSAVDEATSENLPLALGLAGHHEEGADWFDRLFEDAADKLYRIDFTTNYAVTVNTPNLVAETDPKAKCIFMIREPVGRFVSHYYQYERMGIPLPSINDVITKDSPMSRYMFRFCDYTDTLSRFRAVLGADQILCLDFANMRDNPTLLGDQIGAFLDIPDFVFDPSTKEMNVAGRARNKTAQRLMFSDGLKKITRRLPAGIRPALLRIRKKLVQANTEAAAYPELEPKMLDLLEARLAPQIAFYRNFSETGKINAD